MPTKRQPLDYQQKILPQFLQKGFEMEQVIQFIKCWKCKKINRLIFQGALPGNVLCSHCKAGIVKQEVARGYVYILSNPSMKGLLKIGFTERTPEERLTELQSTGVPTDFVLEYKFLSRDPLGDEKKIHEALDAHRINKRREFFEISLELALDVINRYCDQV